MSNGNFKRQMNSSFDIDFTIPGWQDEQDLIQYAKLARSVPKNGVIVEVGAGLGQTTYVLARNADPSVTVHAIDTWRGQDFNRRRSAFCNNYTDGLANSLENFARFTSTCKNITPHRGHSPFESWNVAADLVMIDVEHTKEEWSGNIDFWMKKLTAGGVLGGCDYMCIDRERSSPIKEDFQMIKSVIDNKSVEYGKKIYNNFAGCVWFYYS